MDLELTAAETVGWAVGERPAIRIITASAAELAAHERVLSEIDKESKGKTLWRSLAA
jgi:DNA polymerase-3 subunit epsilon